MNNIQEIQDPTKVNPPAIYEPENLKYVYPDEKDISSTKISIIILQIILWIFLSYLIIDLILWKMYTVSIPLFAFIYVITTVCHFYSTEYELLGNKVGNKSMSEIMGEYFKAPPKIKMKTESYHTVRTGSGKRKTYRRVVTHRDEEEVKYYSYQDVSGLFLLDLPKSRRIIYVQLQIINEISFADPISYSDYVNQKVDFFNRNKKKDKRIDFFEDRAYDGYKRFNLVKLSKMDSCFFSKGMYLIFVFLTLGIVYLWIFNFFCIKQSFKVRKLVSTRYNLQNEENSKKYQSLRPTLTFNSEVYNYDSKDIGQISEINKKDLPSKEELENANQFINQIPEYQISYVNTFRNVGIVTNNMNNNTSCQNGMGGVNQIVELNNINSSDINKSDNSEQELEEGMDYNQKNNTLIPKI